MVGTFERNFATGDAEVKFFETKLFVDNVPRLTLEYNRSLVSLKRYFPEFY